MRTAYGLLSTNLLVLPGLGSWAGGRHASGAVQMAAATLGLALTLWGVAPFFLHVSSLLGDPEELLAMMAQQMPVMGSGIGFFMAAWLWGLIEGLSMVRQAKKGAMR